MPEPHAESQSSPEEASSSSSWADLLVHLIRGFVLLRDIFGYLLPGVLFLLIGSAMGQLSMFGEPLKSAGANLSPWFLVLALLVICYLVGQFVVATSYLVEDVPRLLAKAWYKLSGKAPKTNDQEKQDAADFLRLHKQLPGIYVEYDRQSIIALLRRGLAASVVLAIIVFYYLHRYPTPVIAGAGAIMLFNAISGHFYIKDKLKPDTLAAARKAEALQRRTGK